MLKTIFKKFSQFIFFTIFPFSLLGFDAHSATLSNVQSSNLKLVNWKLLFNDLFALEIEKDLRGKGPKKTEAEIKERLDEILYAFSSYAPQDFNQIVDYVSEAGSSIEAYARRARILQDENERNILINHNLRGAIYNWAKLPPKAKVFIENIEKNSRRPVVDGENIFNSPEGKNIIEAITLQPDGTHKGTIFLMVPGYAAHTIKDYIFEELPQAANEFYGRPKNRPVFDGTDMLNIQFEDYFTFYSRGSAEKVIFDVLHPAGAEMGNTAGYNFETADLLADWIKKLPAKYNDTKIIILSYSKGAPVVLELQQRHPELANRISGFVSYAGVLQGTHIARDIVNDFAKISGDHDFGEFIDSLNQRDLEEIVKIALPALNNTSITSVHMDQIKQSLELFDLDAAALENQTQNFIQSRELREIVIGAKELTPEERTKWNLLNFNNKTFPNSVFMFNMTAVTNVEDLMHPDYGVDNVFEQFNFMAPDWNNKGKFNWKDFNVDSLFLYFSSLTGFQRAPGGLFDTQVDLANTKSILIDRRPLNASLTKEEVARIWKVPTLQAKFKLLGIPNATILGRTPRNKLFTQKEASNITSIDLGEIRCHHWCTFRQALRPEKEPEVAEWQFPRMAYMRALLQTIALYNATAANN